MGEEKWCVAHRVGFDLRIIAFYDDAAIAEAATSELKQGVAETRKKLQLEEKS